MLFIGIPFQYALVVAAGISGLQAGLDTVSEMRKIKAGKGLSLRIDLRRQERRKL